MLFSLGGSTVAGVTDGGGVADASIPLNAVPDDYDLMAAFSGSDGLAPATASRPFAITKSPTQLAITKVAPVTAGGTTNTGITATLLDAKNGPLQRTVYFVLTGPGTTTKIGRSPPTSSVGRRLGTLALGAGTWNVTARFLGPVSLPGGAVTLTDDTYLGASTADSFVAPAEDTTAPDGRDLLADRRGDVLGGAERHRRLHL